MIIKIIGVIAFIILAAFMIIAAITVFCCIRVGSQADKRKGLERPDLINFKK